MSQREKIKADQGQTMTTNKSVFYQDVEQDLNRRSFELIAEAHEIITDFSKQVTAHKGGSKITLKLILEHDEFGLPVVQWYDSRKNAYLPDNYVSGLVGTALDIVPWLRTLLVETEKCLDVLRNEVEFLGNVCRKVSFWKMMDARGTGASSVDRSKRFSGF